MHHLGEVELVSCNPPGDGDRALGCQGCGGPVSVVWKFVMTGGIIDGRMCRTCNRDWLRQNGKIAQDIYRMFRVRNGF